MLRSENTHSFDLKRERQLSRVSNACSLSQLNAQTLPCTVWNIPIGAMCTFEGKL
jgi:hypothetical protein